MRKIGIHPNTGIGITVVLYLYKYKSSVSIQYLFINNWRFIAIFKADVNLIDNLQNKHGVTVDVESNLKLHVRFSKHFCFIFIFQKLKTPKYITLLTILGLIQTKNWVKILLCYIKNHSCCGMVKDA